MFKTFALIPSLLLAATVLPAQTAPASIQATGTATINVTPDQAQLTITVTTNGTTANEAGQLNASLSTTVQNAVKQVLGTSGTIQTVGYSVNTRYNNNGTAIIGFTASNSILVTTINLGIIGTIIDTANQAGATNVGGISFGLQNHDPATQQALTAATKQAMLHATAIASGLGMHTGAVLNAVEGSSYTPVIGGVASAGAATTPITTGTVGVSATVTVTMAIVP